MKETYDFKLDIDNWVQVGDTRLFEIEERCEQVNKFIEDNDLFKEGEYNADS